MKNLSRIQGLLGVLCCGFNLYAASTLAAMAQAVATASLDGDQLSEVLVTAQRRLQSLQEVPLSVSALTEEMLQTQGIAGLHDLTAAVPGLQIAGNQKYISPYIRGVGTQPGGVGIESSVATYVDGVYIAAQTASYQDFNSIERIEVLKGPQGTLFGRNSTGGLIQVITKDPTTTPAAQTSLGFGNYNTTTASAYATTGLGENLSANVSVNWVNQGEGWGRNIFTNREVFFSREIDLRSKLLWTPGDNRFLLSADYSHNTTDIGQSVTLLPGSVAVGGTLPPPSIYDTEANVPDSAAATQSGVSLNAQHHFPEATLTSITAYRKVDEEPYIDSDSTPLNLVGAIQTGRTWTFQEEVLLQGDVGRLDYTTGVFYFLSSAEYDPLALRGDQAPAVNYDLYSRQKTDSIAGYAQGSYAVFDGTNLTAGLRYTKDSLTMNAREIAVPPNTVPAGSIIAKRNDDKGDFSKPTWRVGIDHKLAADIMIYANASRGFKSGTFAIYNIANPLVKPETLDAYEVGLKSEWFARLLTVNLSAYHYDYTNIQLSSRINGQSFLNNAAKARIDGGEGEFVVRPKTPLGALELAASVAYINGYYADFQNAILLAPKAGGGNGSSTGSATGNRLIDAPRLTFTLSGNYLFDVGQGQVGLDLGYYHNSGFYGEPDNRLYQPQYKLLNGSIKYVFPNKAVDIRVYGYNLLNEKYFTVINSSSYADRGVPGAPLTYGAEISVKF